MQRKPQSLKGTMALPTLEQPQGDQAQDTSLNSNAFGLIRGLPRNVRNVAPCTSPIDTTSCTSDHVRMKKVCGDPEEHGRSDFDCHVSLSTSMIVEQAI